MSCSSICNSSEEIERKTVQARAWLTCSFYKKERFMMSTRFNNKVALVIGEGSGTGLSYWVFRDKVRVGDEGYH